MVSSNYLIIVAPECTLLFIHAHAGAQLVIIITSSSLETRISLLWHDNDIHEPILMNT